MVMPISFSRAQPWRSFSSRKISCLLAEMPMPPNSFGQLGHSHPCCDSFRYQGLLSLKCSRLGGLRNSGG